jgi:hypothetical protein
MDLSTACPSGTSRCNDVSVDNLLWLVFPVAVVLALLVAWPLTRFLPRRPVPGWILAIIGAVVFVYLYSDISRSSFSLLGFFISVIGVALARGRAIEPHHV